MNKLDISYLTELEPYLDQFDKYKIRGDELTACSPFRSERRPSFSINLSTGLWIDRGGDKPHDKGNFVGLLSFLRGETRLDTIEYLGEVYSTPIDVDAVELSLELQINAKNHYSLENKNQLLSPLKYRHPYLASRGVTETVQRAFLIGYDRQNEAVSFPWLDKDGNLVNIKFRSVRSKYFYYLEDGLPIKNHVYGLHVIYTRKITKVWLVESEIDAMYLWSNGIPAVALGGAYISRKQVELLINSPIESLVIATDNDKAGRKVANRIKEVLGGHLELLEATIPPTLKDINDMSGEQLQNAEIKQISHNFLTKSE